MCADVSVVYYTLVLNGERQPQRCRASILARGRERDTTPSPWWVLCVEVVSPSDYFLRTERYQDCLPKSNYVVFVYISSIPTERLRKEGNSEKSAAMCGRLLCRMSAAEVGRGHKGPIAFDSRLF